MALSQGPSATCWCSACGGAVLSRGGMAVKEPAGELAAVRGSAWS